MYFRHKRKSAGELSLSDALETDGDGNALALQDVICCEDERLGAVEEHDRYHAMHRALAAALSPREREIAKRFGISRSYVSRIEKRALDKLRDALGDDG